MPQQQFLQEEEGISAHNDWWKEAVVYQVYPRSFKDANSDGVGDLQGIIGQLDYIKTLGVDAVWLNPVFTSPNDDGGYDISDYYSIQPEFGTMADFDLLLQGLHDRGLRLIMDVVVNHSSDEHVWFEASRKSKSNAYRDFYFWKPGKNGGPPNNWTSFFGSSAWQYDALTDEYYLHLFSRKQPDLNWEHPALRAEVHKIMQFWLEKGVDGLRLDVISAISKHTDFPDTDTSDFNETIRKFYTNGPRMAEFLREMREKVWDQYAPVTIGEGPGITPDNAALYLHESGGMSMVFHFGHMFMGEGPDGRFDQVPWTMTEFKDVFAKWNAFFAGKYWGSVFLGNHDFPRMVSRWGDDGLYWKQSATLLATLLLTMPGTPFIYQGDEIGMTNIVLNDLSEFNDIDTRNASEVVQKRGISKEAFIKIANKTGRDNARTPMQWDDSRYAGFSESAPWMPVNPNKNSINVADQLRQADSVLHFYKSMIALRKANPVLVYGEYIPVETRKEPVFAYYRILDEEKWMVVLNFSAEIFDIQDIMPLHQEFLIGNYSDSYEHGILRPWEACIFKY